MRLVLATATIALVVPLATACPASAMLDADGSPSRAGLSSPSATSPAAGSVTTRRAKVPTLKVSTYLGGLSHPWDVGSIGDGRVLITERSPARLVVASGDGHRTVTFPSKRIWDSGETGLMGLEVDPAFKDNRRFYTCSGWIKSGGGHDIRVNAWKLRDGKAHLVKPLITGFPTTSGRHGGCRLLITHNGSMIVGTGDAATGTNPRNLRSLGGKTLRLDRFTGKPWASNPFVKSTHRNKRYVQTYGHRNVQGLAERRDGTFWSIEQGTDRDDEVNRLVRGGDYGYHPVPGYNESVPMTDQSLPGKQVAARWRSGNPTLATSGGTFLYGKGWGALNGAMAVAALKAERLVFLTFNSTGKLKHVRVPAKLTQYGRLRTAVQLPGGGLLVCTDGDGATGKVLLVKPRS